MARPKKEEIKKPITVRLSEGERRGIQEKAEKSGYGNNISAYIRQCAINGEGIIIVENGKEIMDCLYKIDRVLIPIEKDISINNKSFNLIREEMRNICALLNLSIKNM